MSDFIETPTLETSNQTRRTPSAGFLLMLTLLAAGPVAADSERATGLALEPCHLPRISEWARCGTFQVPEDYDQPDGRQIDLRIAVLPAFSQPAKPDPVFLLAGGPGQSAVAIAAAAKLILGEANLERDIILVDQRGSGESSPLKCDLSFDQLAFDPTAKDQAIRKCLDELEPKADPTKYGTFAHVRDLEAVRKVLGADKIHLYGASYGTRVGQVYLREFPDSLQTITLDAVASMDMRVGLQMGTDAQLALDAVMERCRDDSACATRFPNLKQRFDDLLADLEADPQAVQWPDPSTGELTTLAMDHRFFALGLRGLLYSPQTQRLIPLLIDQASAGQWTGFIGASSGFTASLEDVMTPGLLLAVLCTEDLAGVGAADISQAERDSFLGTTQADEFIGYCNAWPKAHRAADFTPVNHPEVPVLLLSGTLDPVTPPYLADRVAIGLRSRHLVVSAGGHTVGAMGCMPDLIGQFIDSSDADGLDVSCLEDIAYPSFFISSLGPKP